LPIVETTAGGVGCAAAGVDACAEGVVEGETPGVPAGLMDGTGTTSCALLADALFVGTTVAMLAKADVDAEPGPRGASGDEAQAAQRRTATTAARRVSTLPGTPPDLTRFAAAAHAGGAQGLVART
jgi:hypothetical protein